MSRRKDNLITCMLITANVGTIFEESTLLEFWFHQLKSYLSKIKPQLVAIHCQEVGGKNFETSMKNVSNFTNKILDDQTIVNEYSRVRIFLDENFECLEKFTALGSLYLVHDSVDNVKLFNFKTAQYDLVEGREIFAASDLNDIAATTSALETSRPDNKSHKFEQDRGLTEHVEKIKFPLRLFPECRWSRKGFMRTRWLINNGRPLDLVNIHLFHDASNLVAMKATPSPYAQNRQKALEFALNWLSQPLGVTVNNNISGGAGGGAGIDSIAPRDHNQVPMFIFGDFNFRLDTNRVIQRITEGAAPVIKRSADSNEVLEFVYHRKSSGNAKPRIANKAQTADGSEDKIEQTSGNLDCGNHIEDGSGVVMTVGKKLFDCENLDEMFRATKNTEWLLELDTELDSFKGELHEFKISFSPSYPFKEDETGGHSYMKTRCPAWCDRILFNAAGSRIIRGGCGGESRILGCHGAFEENANLASEIKIEQPTGDSVGQGDVIYRLMGSSVPMGDHKPVLLYCHLDLAYEQEADLVRPAASTTSHSTEMSTGSSLVEFRAM